MAWYLLATANATGLSYVTANSSSRSRDPCDVELLRNHPIAGQESESRRSDHTSGMFAALVVVTSLAAPLRVAVTGAGGQTGQHAFRKMLARPDEFLPIGIARTQESRSALLESGIPAESVVVADVTDAEAIAAALKGCDALIIGTSAKPAPTGETDEQTGRPVFSFPNGQPEKVDWEGQKAQIDACGPNTHVVICSSMGGTDPSNMCVLCFNGGRDSNLRCTQPGFSRLEHHTDNPRLRSCVADLLRV